MQDICPLPIHWNRIFSRLCAAATASGRDVPEPPVPLILAGWAYSNDVDKQRRWRDTVSWAERWGFTRIIADEITPEMMYRVSSPTTYQVGPLGGPMYLPWDFDLKPTVSREQADRAIEILRDQWPEIAGPDLCEITRPLRFTGAKKRRLVVDADHTKTPPWGTWTRLGRGVERRAFTRFRAAVNAAIAPLMVDHIDFVHEGPEQQSR